MKPARDIYDVIIVGGGPAGCNAAIVLARCKRKVLLIDEGRQRNLRSRGMHNFLTRDGILPQDYIALAGKELKLYGVKTKKARATGVKALADIGFEITDNKANKYLCRRLLLATGVTDHIPDVPGMQELWGSSVFHCPFCDGWECRDKIIGLYAQKHNGYGMSLALRQLTDRVVLFTDGAYYLKPWQKKNLQALHIPVISNRIEKLEYDSQQLNAVVLKKGSAIACDAMFILHGHSVNAELLQQLNCDCTKLGAALTNRHQQTNIKGVYVAGDASFDMHMVIVAAAEGAKAGAAIHNDLLRTDNLIK